MHSRKTIARSLAAAFVSGSLDVEHLVEMGARVLRRRWKWLGPLAQRITQTFGTDLRPQQTTLQRFILNDEGFCRACKRYQLRLDWTLAICPTMSAMPSARGWKIRYPVSTPGELAAWLDLSPGELDWFADRRRLASRHPNSRLCHYRYKLLTKRFGQFRLIEAPKPRLKLLQRKILSGILEQVPPHRAAHGFRSNRSIVTFAQPHVGKDVVIKLDLQDFFTSVQLARIQALFRSLGYPESVAHALAGLCSNSVPSSIWGDATPSPERLLIHQQIRRYDRPHLPQGAPTSPALANLCAFRMDCRLEGLARSVEADYTRYADDLVFSGTDRLGRVARRFHWHACAIVMEEGFSVHHRKTRIMKQSAQQRIAGLVVNQRLSVDRREFDRLKATLTNCVRLGPDSQNREQREDFRSHLEGRVSFFEMVNATRGQRLRKLLAQIPW